MTAREHVLVMAKEPRPGRVKTRLCPPCSREQAAAVAEAALADTLEAVSRSGASRRIVALEGRPGLWLPPGFEVIAQRGAGLSARLGNAWADAGGPGVQIGMDTPQVEPAELDRLLAAVAPGRAVLGHSVDGGWWVIGLAMADPRPVFQGVPMSTAETGRRQEQRLRFLGLDVSPAAVRRDIDTAADLTAVAREAPATRTAALAARIGLGACPPARVA
jgi:glycosyltransferase A (GT-A) superfamily protein (DUF2064 family)